MTAAAAATMTMTAKAVASRINSGLQAGKRARLAVIAALALAALTSTAPPVHAQFTPSPRAAFVNPTGTGWNPWAAVGSGAALGYTPQAVGLYCSATGTAGTWIPCLGSGGGGGAAFTPTGIQFATSTTAAMVATPFQITTALGYSGSQVAQPTPASTTFLQALTNFKSQMVKVKIIGDSFTICSHLICGGNGQGPLVSNNRWPIQLANQLQATYGPLGAGMSPLVALAGTTPAAINPDLWSCSGTIDNSNLSLGPYQGTAGSMIHMTTGAICTLNDLRSLPFTNLSVYYATPTTSSSLAVVADGTTALGTATSANSAVAGAAAGGLTSRRFDGTVTLASTTHTVTFACTGDCYLYGAEPINGTTGASVSLMGIGGATAASFGTAPTTQLAFSDLMAGGPAATIVMDQTNDVALQSTTFVTDMTNIITHEQGLASAPTVILAIPPVDVVSTAHSMTGYTDAQRTLCSTFSLTCVNIQDRGATVGSTLVGWGTTYNASSGLWDLTGAAWPTGNAGVHPNDKGSLDEYQQIYAVLVNPSGQSEMDTTTIKAGALRQYVVTPVSGNYTSMTLNGLSGDGSRLGWVGGGPGDNNLYSDIPAGGTFLWRTGNVGIMTLSLSGGVSFGSLTQSSGAITAPSITAPSSGNLFLNGSNAAVTPAGVVIAAGFNGPLTGNASTAGVATNLAGGNLGTVHYQSSTSVTASLTPPVVNGTYALTEIPTASAAVAPVWTNLSNIFSLATTTPTLGGSLLSAGCSTEAPVTVTGATTTMACVMSGVAGNPTGIQPQCSVTAANTVVPQLCTGLATVTPVAQTYNIRVIR